jgi:molybdopterin-binding protein
MPVPRTPTADLLTAQEVAALLHLHVKRVQLLAREGKLPTVRVGRRWLFPREQITRTREPAAAHAGIDLSARNQLRGTIRAVRFEGFMAEVTLRLTPQDVVAVITRDTARRLGLTEGADAMAVVKATEIMIAREVRAAPAARARPPAPRSPIPRSPIPRSPAKG